MRASLHIGMATALILGLLSASAGADVTVYYQAHGWDAFSGSDEIGKQVCGIGTTDPTDKHSFSLRFEIGGDIVTFRAKKATWNIPTGKLLSVVLRIGSDTPWDLQGVGNGQVVEWSLDPGTFQAFEVQFRRTKSMIVTFPSGSEPPWTIALKGSKAISNAFGRSIKVLTQREVTETLQSAQPAGQPTTQPFGEAPAQQPEAGPSQPFAPAGGPAASR
jgi:hypothetical protein